MMKNSKLKFSEFRSKSFGRFLLIVNAIDIILHTFIKIRIVNQMMLKSAKVLFDMKNAINVCDLFH